MTPGFGLCRKYDSSPIRPHSCGWLRVARNCVRSRNRCWRTATRRRRIYDDLAKSNPHFKKLYDSLVPYRASAYAWLQVAELGFDTFQIRMRART